MAEEQCLLSKQNNDTAVFIPMSELNGRGVMVIGANNPINCAHTDKKESCCAKFFTCALLCCKRVSLVSCLYSFTILNIIAGSVFLYFNMYGEKSFLGMLILIILTTIASCMDFILKKAYKRYNLWIQICCLCDLAIFTGFLAYHNYLACSKVFAILTG